MTSSTNDGNTSVNKGSWSADEDRILAEYVAVHGPKKWTSVAVNSGLSRCGKSCRLRWLNYLRPDIKRGNFSDAEDDLILRFHRLLGNRWSLIARRIPGRTDNEIKNYWNAHLRKKAKLMEKLPAMSIAAMKQIFWNDESSNGTKNIQEIQETGDGNDNDDRLSCDDESFEFSGNGTCGLDWVKSFLELEEDE